MKNFNNKNPDSVKSLFNGISGIYDFMDNVISLFTHGKIKKDIVNLIKNDNPKVIADLCCGTGDLTFLEAKKFKNAKIIGVDFSENMINIAKKKNTYGNVEFIVADIRKLPFEENFADVCTVAFGLRNLPSYESGIIEIARILKPGGSVICADFGKPQGFAGLLFNIFLFLLPAAGFFIGKYSEYKYLKTSIKNMPTQGEISEILERQGFSNVKNDNFLFGIICAQSGTIPFKD